MCLACVVNRNLDSFLWILFRNKAALCSLLVSLSISCCGKTKEMRIRQSKLKAKRYSVHSLATFVIAGVSKVLSD